MRQSEWALNYYLWCHGPQLRRKIKSKCLQIAQLPVPPLYFTHFSFSNQWQMQQGINIYLPFIIILFYWSFYLKPEKYPTKHPLGVANLEKLAWNFGPFFRGKFWWHQKIEIFPRNPPPFFDPFWPFLAKLIRALFFENPPLWGGGFLGKISIFWGHPNFPRKNGPKFQANFSKFATPNGFFVGYFSDFRKKDQ